ncbi:MAG: nucleotide sugar dehydrogenase [Nitrospiraceae bacterium]
MRRWSLKKKIEQRKAVTCVMGLGYIGLAEAINFAEASYRVVGVDINPERVKQVNAGSSYIADVGDDTLARLIRAGRLSATGDVNVLREADCVCICVPTPLRKTGDPDISYVLAAVEAIRATLHPGQLIILESTTYPGATEEAVLPLLESTGLKVGRDFYLAFSPERINPGDGRYPLASIPRVVGGITPRCREMATAFFRQVVDRVFPVSSARAAEMVKLLENTFRSVNVGLVNELALMCHNFDLDVWEIVDAAATKPFGFMPFYPGPGLGGHCIPIDPVYLSWRARANGFEPRFIDLATAVNANMPGHIVSLITEAFNRCRKSVNGSKILIIGVAYKADVSDTRESPALEIVRRLRASGATVTYHDPLVPELCEVDPPLKSLPLTAKLVQEQDLVVIVTDHRRIDYTWLVHHASLVVDTRNATRGIPRGKHKVVKL